MNDRIIKFRVGVVVIFAILITGILIAAFSDVTSFTRGEYTIFVKFQEAPGIAPGTPVRKSGILIGRVENTEFADDGDGVIVQLNIRGNVKLHQDEVCRIRGGLLGDSVIEFVTAKNRAKAAVLISPGEYIDGSVTGNPLEAFANMEGNLSGAANAVGDAGTQIARLAETMNKTLANNDDQFQRILDKTETALDGFKRTINNLDGVIGDEKVRHQLRESIVEMPQLFKQSRDTLDRMQDTIESANRNMRNLEGFTAPLGERGDQLVGKIDTTVGRLDELLAQFVQFGKQLNEQDGTLGKLVRDPELYQNLNKAAQNIEQLTCELKPIVRDARSFSDKISRHPELLGVRGAIQKSSGIK